jgi:hypothetical protein
MSIIHSIDVDYKKDSFENIKTIILKAHSHKVLVELDLLVKK